MLSVRLKTQLKKEQYKTNKKSQETMEMNMSFGVL